MTAYTLRVTIAAPEPLIPAANQLALAIGESRDDDKTFSEPKYQTADGTRYAVASTIAVPQFPQIAASDLEAEAIKRFGDDHPVNLTLALQAQQALVVITTEDDSPISLDPTKITAIIHPDAAWVLSQLPFAHPAEETPDA